MIQLVYLSSTRWLLGEEDIADILITSRRNNARDNITGILLYHSGSVLQMLEGDAAPVHALFEVIKRDHRHHRITLLYDEPAELREFGDWTMAYRDVNAAMMPANPGYSPALEEDFKLSNLPWNRARKALTVFRQSLR